MDIPDLLSALHRLSVRPLQSGGHNAIKKLEASTDQGIASGGLRNGNWKMVRWQIANLIATLQSFQVYISYIYTL
jgi:hypothetical protein